LAWLAAQQARDGHWETPGRGYPVSVTALAGMTFLMEGSTVAQGRYATQIRKARDWLLAQVQPDGLIADPNTPEMFRPLFGHGYAMLFLASACDGENNRDLRRKLVAVLTRAARYARRAQTSRGGWGYSAARAGGDFDEASVTVVLVQALRAARAAGIALPRGTLRDGLRYLDLSTTRSGGVLYTRGRGDPSPTLTAAAVACARPPAEFASLLVRGQLLYCRENLPLSLDVRVNLHEFTHYYLAQVAYALGEDGWGRLFPASRPAEHLTWKMYRRGVFADILSLQAADGSFAGSFIGPAYTTAVCLAILQFDNGCLPIYQRTEIPDLR
jgi:hypothetical protein